ncbi:diphthamide biosynthesis protein [Trifolium repens]|nr:diphthamide biosynthesis protein [Trifolium repens]
MSYDDVEIEDMEWNEELQSYTYPCPCGDLFQITKEDLKLAFQATTCYRCLNFRCTEMERAINFAKTLIYRSREHLVLQIGIEFLLF